MKSILWVVGIILIAFCATGQNTVTLQQSKIDKHDLKKIVRILSSDSLEGRETGTAGQIKAANFISKRFKEIGVKSYNSSNHMEPFNLSITYWNDVYLETENKRLENFNNIIYLGSKIENSVVEKEVVFGGYGTIEDLAQIDVKNKLVLLFSKNLRSTFLLNNNLKDLQAYGIIAANPDNEVQFESIKHTYKSHALQKICSLVNPNSLAELKNRWGGYTLTTEFIIPNYHVKSVLNTPLKKLKKAVLDREISKIPTSKVKIKMQRIVDTIQTANVCGIIKGSSEKSIIITAHYDHIGKIRNTIFPGADDNASGIAALLEIAEEFTKYKDLPYNLIFIATSGEEKGLLGSKYHVRTNTFDSSKVICNLNLDMIARSDTLHTKNQNYLYCLGSKKSVQLNTLLKKASDEYRLCVFDFSLEDTEYPFGLYT